MSVYELEYWTNGPGSKPPPHDMKRAIEAAEDERRYLLFNQHYPFDDPKVVALDKQLETARAAYRAAGGS